MRAAVFERPGRVVVEELPDPVLRDPGDAIVRVVAAGVCGSDLWTYRGLRERPPGTRMGHEFVGVVEAVGDGVAGLEVGDWVVAPFMYADGSCAHCLRGVPTSCLDGGLFGGSNDGGQGELVRVPHASASLVRAARSGEAPDADLVDDLLTLADVFSTGHHAALSSGAGPGSTAVVVGDGAVGLLAVLAARRLGAARVIALSGHEDRQSLAREFGASDVVPLRGPAAVEAVLDLTAGLGADAVMECVGTAEAFTTACTLARPGSRVGYVGIPHGVDVPLPLLFARNVGVAGGLAPARSYIDELLPDVLERRVQPGRVFTGVFGLASLQEAYAAMDERREIKALVDLRREQGGALP